MKGFGIDTAWQLRNLPQEWFKKNFGGVVGDRLLRQLKGEAISDMKPPLVTKKMIATTRMFGRRVTELNEIEEAIASYTARAAEKLRRQFCAAGEMSVFIMYQDMNVPKGEYVVRNSWNYALLPVPTSDTIALTKLVADSVFCYGRKVHFLVIYLAIHIFQCNLIPRSEFLQIQIIFSSSSSKFINTHILQNNYRH